MKDNGSDDYLRAFVASKYNQTLMKKMSLQAHTTLFSISSSTLGVATTTLFSISNTGSVGHGRQRDWHADPIMPQNLDQIAAAATGRCKDRQREDMCRGTYPHLCVGRKYVAAGREST